ncbi:MAG: glycosyltransferase family 2 protein, partial [Novosphingobium sp.]
PLAEELCRTLPTLGEDVTGIRLKRRHVFMGRWIRHGGRYPLWMLRVFRPGAGYVEQRWMDEHIVVRQGRVVAMRETFTDENLKDLTFFVDKHNRYATREALQIILERHGLIGKDLMAGEASSRQAAIKRWIKIHIYNKVPFQVSTVAYFIYRYVFQLGFLDGRQGVIYHGLQGLWYRFLVGARTWELERALAGIPDDRIEIRAALLRLTGLDIDSEPCQSS